jgi:hypothetical protein
MTSPRDPSARVCSGVLRELEGEAAMSYLEPPPMPAPVVVHKDVGGFVGAY